MKKLMVIAAVVLAAVAANAATTKWAFTSAAMKGCNLTSSYNGLVQIWASGGDLEEDVMIGSKSTTTGTVSQYKFTTDDLTVGQKYNIYYILTDTKDEVEYTLTSSSKPLTAQNSSEASIGFGNQASYTSKAANWVAAPEPTSGLLLLLGMAGLALKRKRA